MLRLIDGKVQDILEDPYRFKPLRKPLQNKRRVHVGGPFVLFIRIWKLTKVIWDQGFKKIYQTPNPIPSSLGINEIEEINQTNEIDQTTK